MTADTGAKPAQTPSTEPLPPPARFETQGSGRFNGVKIDYRAIAGETYIRDEKGEPKASVFSVAYVKSDVKDPTQRPVAFIFNGGPGSSSLWLHMGAFGPKRVVVPSDALNAGAAPYPVIDNAESILDRSDVVFLDAIGTGYSRAINGKENKEFWGLLEDANAVADFIRAWLNEHGRWNSPKYIIGESYGTTRAALVAEILSTHYVAVNGVALVSAVLDFQNTRPRPGDGGILAYASFVPTYAATAWYHGKVDRKGRTLESFLDEARLFARTDYVLALIANNRLAPEERSKVVKRLAGFTGLKPAFIEQCNLRIQVSRYFKELLRDEGKVVGRLDSRYTGVETEAGTEAAESDPSIDSVASAFVCASNAHLRELGVRMDREYRAFKVIEDWNWQLEKKPISGGGYVNIVPHLGRAMRRNKDLRVLVTSGYYDLATTFFGIENALSQEGVVHENITYTYYEVGHMIFLHEPSRVQFLKDIGQFIRGPQ